MCMTHSPHMPSGWVSQLNSWCWLVLSRGVWVSMQSQFPHSLCLPHLSSLRLLESQFDPPALLSRTINSVQFSQLDFFPPLVLSLNTSTRGGGTKENKSIQIAYSFKLGTFCFKCTICSFNPTVFPVSGSSTRRAQKPCTSCLDLTHRTVCPWGQRDPSSSSRASFWWWSGWRLCHRLTHYFLSLCGLAPGVTVTVRHALPDPA